MAGMKEILLRLLPELYLTSDESGDLEILLFVIGLTLDELKGKIERIPGLMSPRNCPPDFLGHLAALLGDKYDPKAHPTPQRQRIREAVERYRRQGTTLGLDMELSRLGWEGEVVETFRDILRLNYRSRLGRQKLPGKRHNHGIYGITQPLETGEFFEKVHRHQPAGTIVWLKKERYDI